MKKIQKYNCAIIGLGNISKYYIKAIINNKYLNLIKICDQNSLVKKQISSQHELKDISFCKNYQEICNDNNIDLVFITTPNDSHFQITQKCLLSKKHTIVEKPLALSSIQTEELVNLAYKQKVLLMTVFHRRYNKYIKDLIKNKKKIKIIFARYLENINDHSNGQDWYLDNNKSGGGCVLDNGINVIDVIRHIVGEIKIKNAFISYKNKLDKNAFIEFIFKNGRGFIHLDWFYNGEVKDINLFTQKGEILYRDFLKDSVGFKTNLYQEYESAILDIVNCLNKKKYHQDTDSITAIKLVEKIYNLAKYNE